MQPYSKEIVELLKPATRLTATRSWSPRQIPEMFPECLSDVDLAENKIRLKPMVKMCNHTVLFDDEVA